MKVLILRLMVVVMAAGCVTVGVQETQVVSTEITPEGSVVVLLSDSVVHEGQITGVDEDQITGCIGEAIHERIPTLGVIPAGEFRSRLFPWFERSTAPTSPDQAASLLRRPQIRERVATLGVRYIIVLSGSSEVGALEGDVSRRRPDPVGELVGELVVGVPLMLLLGIAPSGSHGQIYYAWDVRSEFQAQIWDLNEGELVGEAQASASGRSRILNIPLPTPLTVNTQRQAERRLCSELGEHLARVLAGVDE